jgi:transposase
MGRVTEKSIRNCFRHAGISSRVQEGVDVTEKEVDVDDDDDLPLSEWVRKIDCGVLGQYDYDAYATIDETLLRPIHKQTKRLSEKWEARTKKKQKNRKKKIRRRKKRKKLSCKFPL